MTGAQKQKAARELAKAQNRAVTPDELEQARRPEPRSRVHRVLRILGVIADVAEVVPDPRVQAAAAGVELANDVADTVAELRQEHGVDAVVIDPDARVEQPGA